VNNKQRITLVSFLAYFVLSGMLAPIGIISQPMAELYGRPVAEITSQFSWLTGGDFIGAVAALFVFEWVDLRRMLVVIYALIALSLLSLAYFHSLAYGRAVLGVAGVCGGIGLAGAALTIARTYQAERRASLLVITDGCFSVAGFVCGSLASHFVARKLGWSSTYQCIGLLAAVIVALSLASTFPATVRKATTVRTGGSWSMPVWLCATALFLYTLGQYSMLFWLPNYAHLQLGASAALAGSIVGKFWLGMFLAQVFVAWWVLRIGLRRLVAIAAVTTALGSIPLWSSHDPGVLPYLALIWGIGNLSMLKSLLSFATTMVRVPDARLVSGLLLGATLGTAISPAVSSLVVEWAPMKVVLICATACDVAMLMLVLLARRLQRTAAVPVADGDVLVT
jgi:MFS transporter, TsgA protein